MHQQPLLRTISDADHLHKVKAGEMAPAGGTQPPDSVPRSVRGPLAAEMDELVDVLIEVPGRCTRPGVDRSRRRWHSGGAAAARPVVHNVSRAELQERRWGPGSRARFTDPAPRRPPRPGRPVTPKTEPETEVEAGT